MASKYAIGCVEDNKKLAWWKILLLKCSYNWDNKKHILLNNLEPLNCLKIKVSKKQPAPTISQESVFSVKDRLEKQNIGKFLIFHPSAQYKYKLYSQNLRNDLLGLLNKLRTYELQSHGLDTIDANLALGFDSDQRNYVFASEMLRLLKIKEVKLITNNPDKGTQLKNGVIKVRDTIQLKVDVFDEAKGYLETKKRRSGHNL